MLVRQISLKIGQERLASEIVRWRVTNERGRYAKSNIGQADKDGNGIPTSAQNDIGLDKPVEERQEACFHRPKNCPEHRNNRKSPTHKLSLCVNQFLGALGDKSPSKPFCSPPQDRILYGLENAKRQEGQESQNNPVVIDKEFAVLVPTDNKTSSDHTGRRRKACP